jgi:ubiquinone biosynthesis monooxygenase Coq7
MRSRLHDKLNEAMTAGSTRRYSPLDRILGECDHALKTLFSHTRANLINPAINIPEAELNAAQQRHAAGLMRVDHTGEICAQALYRGQACFARTEALRQDLHHAAEEENDHLAWCQDRLGELHSHTSYLNLLWYSASFKLGLLAAMTGDAWSLGFIVETEKQVMQHLEKHLQELPAGDSKSRAILQQMHTDEAKHATAATNAGGRQLPLPIRWLMRLQSKVMTTVAYYI